MSDDGPGDVMTFCTDPSCRHIREIHDENGCDMCACTRSADRPEYFAAASTPAREEGGERMSSKSSAEAKRQPKCPECGGPYINSKCQKCGWVSAYDLNIPAFNNDAIRIQDDWWA